LVIVLSLAQEFRFSANGTAPNSATPHLPVNKRAGDKSHMQANPGWMGN
jgi:hypothetical protein